MAKSKDRGAGTGGRDQKKKPQKTIKEKRAAKKTKGIFRRLIQPATRSSERFRRGEIPQRYPGRVGRNTPPWP